ARAACSAMALPSPGPMPQTTTTLSCSSPTRLPTPLPLHPLGDGGLARGDPFGGLLRRDAGLLVVGRPPPPAPPTAPPPPPPAAGEETPAPPLPSDLHVPAPVAGELQPVRDAGVTLADHEPQEPVRIDARLVTVKARLVVDVVERDVPGAAELDPLVRRDRAV